MEDNVTESTTDISKANTGITVLPIRLFSTKISPAEIKDKINKLIIVSTDDLFSTAETKASKFVTETTNQQSKSVDKMSRQKSVSMKVDPSLQNITSVSFLPKVTSTQANLSTEDINVVTTNWHNTQHIVHRTDQSTPSSNLSTRSYKSL